MGSEQSAPGSCKPPCFPTIDVCGGPCLGYFLASCIRFSAKQLLTSPEAGQWHSRELRVEPAGLGLKATTVVFISAGTSLSLSFSA